MELGVFHGDEGALFAIQRVKENRVSVQFHGLNFFVHSCIRDIGRFATVETGKR